MFRPNNVKKFIAGLLLTAFVLQVVAVPLPARAQQQQNSGATAVYAVLGAAAATALTWCILQAAGKTDVTIFGVTIPVPKTPFQCTITNPPGFHLFSADGLKKFVLDPAARIAVRALLQATTQQIVAWIQGDSGKNVGYVANLEAALRRELDIRGGEFLNQLTGINLCGNIGAFLQITLRTPGLRQRLACTVTDIVANLQNFYRNFEEGGWPAFIRISLEPQNNPYGAYLIALDAKIEAESSRQIGFLEPLRKSFPFEGFKVPTEKCETISAAEVEAGVEAGVAGEIGEVDSTSGIRVPTSEVLRERGVRKVCHTEYEIKTPGTLIADGLSKATFIGLDFSVVAKEFDEAIAVIINAAINKIIQSSFLSEGGGATQSGRGIFDPGFSSLPKEDLAQNVISQQADGAFYQVDAILAALDAKLQKDRQELFAEKQKAEDSRDASKIAALKASVSENLERKRKVLLSQFDLILMRRSFQDVKDPSEVSSLGQRLPLVIFDLTDAAGGVEDIPAVYIPSGDLKADTLQTLRASEGHLKRAMAIIDDTAKEIDRVVTATSDSGRRNDLTARRNAALTQKTLLEGQLDPVLKLTTEVAGTTNQDRIRDISRGLSNRLITINSVLDQATGIIFQIDAVLKP